MTSLFLISGLSYITLILASVAPEQFLYSYITLFMVLFSFPHFVATYIVWGTKVSSWKSEWIPILFPLFYVCFFFYVYKSESSYLSVEIILKLTYLYLVYHFAQQLYGVTLWSSAKYQQNFTKRRKYILRALFLSSALYAWLEMEMREASNVLFYHSVTSWKLSSSYLSICFFAVLGLSLILIALGFKDFFKKKTLKVFVPLLSIGLTWIWFLPPINHKMILFLPMLHGIQYYPFIFMKAKNISRIKLYQLAILSVCVGWILFRWLPFNISLLNGTLWPALVLSTLNIHHFIIDGRIWKLSDPSNRDLASSFEKPQF
jgi:hypothetical protein